MNLSSLLTENLISWIVQVSAIAALGAVLPRLFQIRHPKTQLAFSHFILAGCILLPLIETWQHPLVLPGGTIQVMSSIRPGHTWITYLEWIIAAGIVAKISWLIGGLWQIHRYRSSSTPLFLVPESVREARTLTGADARIGISRYVDGPATLGYLDPIILLPESFLSLDHDAQLSIICHELLHVRRRDWLTTLAEKLIGVVFWFNPAVWMLLSQTRLSREQIVDAEVVALTAAPAPYVQALLVMAGAPRKSMALPAAYFFSEDHLPHRLRSLLTKRRGSVVRLAGSYALIACLLAVFMVAVTAWFPLIGAAYTVEIAARKHALPPTLIARTKPLVIAEIPPSKFNVHVPAPASATQDVLFYVAGNYSGATDQESATLLPAPPVSPSPPPQLPTLHQFGMSPGRELRLFTLGERVTLEDIARAQVALGDRALIEVMRTDDGTVQRVTILRRSAPDEINSIGPVNAGAWPGRFFTAIPAVPGAGDSVH